jgi:hypothetical protein
VREPLRVQRRRGGSTDDDRGEDNESRHGTLWHGDTLIQNAECRMQTGNHSALSGEMRHNHPAIAIQALSAF